MTAIDFANLRRALFELPPTVLQGMDDGQVAWLPRLRSIPSDRVHDAICEAAQTARPKERRLYCIAWLYSWMASRRRMGPWTVFRFRAAVTLNDCFSVLQDIAFALKCRKRPGVTIAWNEHLAAVNCCLLLPDWMRTLDIMRTREFPSVAVEHSAAYAVIWPNTPLLAIHVEGFALYNRLHSALREALRDNRPVPMVQRSVDLDYALFEAMCILDNEKADYTCRVPSRLL